MSNFIIQVSLYKFLYKTTALIKLMRIQHWIKNLFLLIPAFFAGNIFDLTHVWLLIPSFMSFSLVASAIYILNDYRDIASDQLHPTKRTRPLASGIISVPVAITAMAICLIIGLGMAYAVNTVFFAILGFYFMLNVGYSLGFKNISILDIFIVASGFLFRTIAGGVVMEVPISQWLIIMVFLLALFLALAKRRDDVLMFLESGKVMRKSVQEYNLDFTNSCLTFLSAVIMVAYIMYTVSTEVTLRLGTEYVYFTSIFVIAGILRYLQIVFVKKDSGSPTKVLYSDKFIIITILGWVISFYMIIYFK